MNLKLIILITFKTLQGNAPSYICTLVKLRSQTKKTKKTNLI